MYFQAINFKKWAVYGLLGLVGLALSACSDSKKIKTPKSLSDTLRPTVEAFYPNDESSDEFEVDFNVEVIFSELMNIDSLLNEGGIKLFSGKNELDSDVDIEERDVQLEFEVVPFITEDLISKRDAAIPATKVKLTHGSGRFSLNTDYTVRIEEPARDLAKDDFGTSKDERNFIESTHLIDFTTEKGEWKDAKSIPNIIVENPDTIHEELVSVSNNQFAPKLIANGKGETFLFWRQELISGVTQLWMSRYIVNDKEWLLSSSSTTYCNAVDVCANAQLVSDISSTSVVDYDIAINELGHLAVTWSQSRTPSEFVSVWATTFDGNVWGSKVEISDTGFAKSGNAESPKISLDNKGNAVSIWSEVNGQYARVKANIYRPGLDGDILSGNWTGAPAFLDTQEQVISTNPELAMSEEGLVVAVWEQKTSGYSHIYSNHLRVNQTDATSNNWKGAERIDNILSSNPESNIGNSSMPSIVINQNDDAIVIWLKHDGQRNNIWFNRFSGSWGDQSNYLERSRLGDAMYPSIIMGKNNKALAYWVQENSADSSRSLYSSFFSASADWEAERLLATDDELSKPVASFDREGNAVIIWQEGLLKGDINARYYSKLTDTWDKKYSIDSWGADISLTPLFEDGRFLAVWIDDPGSSYLLKSALFSD